MPFDVFFMNSDSDRIIFESLRIVDEHDFFWNAQTVGSVTGPLYLYLISLPLVVSRNIYSPVVFVVVLNIIAVFLCYRLGKDYFGKTVGIISALLFATFPYSVLNFRGNLYNIYILPIFVLVFFHCFLSLIVRKRSIYIVPSFVVLWLSTQIHSIMFCFFPMAIATLLITRPGIKFVYILFTCLIVVMCCVQGFEGLPDFSE